MTEAEESGHHDLCFLGEPCSQEVPQHGFCSRQSTMCIHCERECICERLKQAENYARIAVMHTVDVDSYEQGKRDALDAVREAVASCTWDKGVSSFFDATVSAVLAEALAAIDALKEKR